MLTLCVDLLSISLCFFPFSFELSSRVPAGRIIVLRLFIVVLNHILALVFLGYFRVPRLAGPVRSLWHCLGM